MLNKPHVLCLTIAIGLAAAHVRAQETESPQAKPTVTSAEGSGDDNASGNESSTTPSPSARVKAESPTSAFPTPPLPPGQTAQVAASRDEGAPESVAAGPSDADSENCNSDDGGRERRVGKRWRNNIKPALQYSHWGYAPQFCEPPMGAYIGPYLHAQIAAALTEQLVLYDYDFSDNQGGSALTARGQRQLSAIAHMMMHCDGPLVIESSENNPTRDDARRRAVIAASKTLLVQVPEDRIVVGRPTAIGLRGVEARILDDNLLRRTRSGSQLQLSPSVAPRESAQ